MSAAPLRIAVVGHTNTGKTSLLRTLLRDVDFGEVSNRPAVTRVVEGATLLADGAPVLELFDTPGLEDSIHLLDHLESTRGDQRRDNVELVQAFLEGDAASRTFAQEAKALRQLLQCDAALYVIDARDRVLGKHRDELTILAWCARPVVPVLNFTAADDARTGEWREHLARVGLHAAAEFDTVVYDEDHERRLFETLATLLHGHRTAIDRLVADRTQQRRRLERGSASLIADMLLDVAAHVRTVRSNDETGRQSAEARLRDAVRAREQRCVDGLLQLHGFRPEDCAAIDLPIENGQWGIDLFSPQSLRRFGVRAGSAAAAGAVAGLAIDVMSAGLTLGTATAAGAAVGALYGAARSHAQKLIDKARGLTELRCPDLALRLLIARQVELTRAIMHRGHAAQAPVRLAKNRDEASASSDTSFPRELRTARLNPAWSAINADRPQRVAPADPGRIEAAEGLARHLVALVRDPV